MTMVYTGIRTRRGVMFRSRETITELPQVTKMTPSPMATALATLLVTASVEQIPSIMRNVGLSVHRPAISVLNSLVRPIFIAVHSPDSSGSRRMSC